MYRYSFYFHACRNIVYSFSNHGFLYVHNITILGVWGPYIGAMTGVTVPLVAMRHAYVVTERIEGIQNMPNMRDHDASVYLKLQGDALCVGGYEPNPIFIDKVGMSYYLWNVTGPVFFAVQRNLWSLYRYYFNLLFRYHSNVSVQLRVFFKNL